MIKHLKNWEILRPIKGHIIEHLALKILKMTLINSKAIGYYTFQKSNNDQQKRKKHVKKQINKKKSNAREVSC